MRSARRFAHINSEPTKLDIERNEAVSTDLKVTFSATAIGRRRPRKCIFRPNRAWLVAAWRVLIWQPVNAFYVIVDAETGTMLWRKNITEDQTQSATYQCLYQPECDD